MPQSCHTAAASNYIPLRLHSPEKWPGGSPYQWIDLRPEPLPDGEYALRLVADPSNRIFESPDGNPAREAPEADEAVTTFIVKAGSIVSQPQPWQHRAGAE